MKTTHKKLIIAVAAAVVLIAGSLIAFTQGDLFKGLSIKTLKPRPIIDVYVKDYAGNNVNGITVRMYTTYEADNKHDETEKTTSSKGTVAFSAPAKTAYIGFAACKASCKEDKSNVLAGIQYYYDAVSEKLYVKKGSNTLAPKLEIWIPVQEKNEPTAGGIPTVTVKVQDENGELVKNVWITKYNLNDNKLESHTASNGTYKFTPTIFEDFANITGFYFVASKSKEASKNDAEYGRTSCDFTKDYYFYNPNVNAVWKKGELNKAVTKVVLKPSEIACVKVNVYYDYSGKNSVKDGEVFYSATTMAK